MKIKSISITGLHNVAHKQYTFSDINYFYGNNGAGKSTMLQAIQLALLGYIPGTNQTKKDIMKHSNGSMLSVTLVLDEDGQEIEVTRTWTGKSTISSSVDITPSGYDLDSIVKSLELPIFNFNEFIGMTANKLKDWFIDYLPKAEMNINWNQELDDAVHFEIPKDLLSTTLNRIHLEEKQADGIQLVRNINKYLKEQISLEKVKVKEAEGTIASLLHYDIDFSESVEELNSELEELQKTKLLQSRYEEVKQSNDQIESQLNALPFRYPSTLDDYSKYLEVIKLNEKIEDAVKSEAEQQTARDTKLKDLNARVNELISTRAKLEANIESSKKVIGKTTCPYIEKECPDLIEYSKDIAAQTDELKTKLDEVNTQLASVSSELEAVNTMKIENKSREFTDEVRKYEQIWQQQKALEARLVEVPNVDTNIQVADKIGEIQDKLDKAHANAVYDQLVEQHTDKLDRYRTNLEIFKAWEKLTGVNGLQSNSGDCNPFTEFELKLNKHIQKLFGDDVESKFNIEAQANSFSFGISRNGKYTPYNLLSSGEKCLYAIVLMSELIKMNESPLHILLVDDIFDHLDNFAIDKLFDVMSNLEDMQIITAGVQLPDNADNLDKINFVEIKKEV